MEPTTPARGRHPAAHKLRQTGLILLVLLAAAGLRLYTLADAPPGMTHDEADHGLTAWEIVNGARDISFTVGYGREPLYYYATALVMAGTGPTILAAQPGQRRRRCPAHRERLGALHWRHATTVGPCRRCPR